MPDIWIVFYQRPESDEDLFLSAHATEAGARAAAEVDAADHEYDGWAWGESTQRGILTDWDDDDSGHYEITRTELGP